jgi:hypothetical protein
MQIKMDFPANHKSQSLQVTSSKQLTFSPFGDQRMGMWIFTSALVGAAAVAVQAQLPVPGKPPGFVYGKGTAAAGVQLETYVDLVLCTFLV